MVKDSSSRLVITGLFSQQGSGCPSGQQIKKVYPGQVLTIYTYLCNSTSNAFSLVIPTITVTTSSRIKDPTSYTYYSTHFDDDTRGENAKSVDWGIYVPRNVSEPSKFGIWPALYDEDLEWTVRVTWGAGANLLETSQSFTVISPKLYIKQPNNCSALAYDESTNTVGPVKGQCIVEYTSSPFIPGLYGFMRLITTDLGGGEEQAFGDNSQILTIYKRDTIDDEYVTVGKKFVFGIKNLPESSGDYTVSIEHDMSEERIFIASYLSKKCNIESSDDVENAGKYVLSKSVFKEYLMVKPSLEKLNPTFYSQSFYVPLDYNKAIQQTMDMNISLVKPSIDFAYDGKNPVYSIIGDVILSLLVMVVGYFKKPPIKREYEPETITVNAYFKHGVVNSGEDIDPSDYYMCPKNVTFNGVIEFNASLLQSSDPFLSSVEDFL